MFVFLKALDELIGGVAIHRHSAHAPETLDVSKMKWKHQPALDRLDENLSSHEKMELLAEASDRSGGFPDSNRQEPEEAKTTQRGCVVHDLPELKNE